MLRADTDVAWSAVSSCILDRNNPDKMLRDQRLHKSHDVVRHDFYVHVVTLRKLLQDFIDPARPREQAPDFTRDFVKIEIGSRLQAQNNKAAVDLGGRQACLLNEDAVDCETQRTSPLRRPDIG